MWLRLQKIYGHTCSFYRLGAFSVVNGQTNSVIALIERYVYISVVISTHKHIRLLHLLSLHMKHLPHTAYLTKKNHDGDFRCHE